MFRVDPNATNCIGLLTKIWDFIRQPQVIPGDCYQINVGIQPPMATEQVMPLHGRNIADTA